MRNQALADPLHSPLRTPLNDLTESGFLHMIEHDVRRRLLAREDMSFHSLVVHRVGVGLCLEGVLESEIENPVAEVIEFVREATGIEQVRSLLVVRESRPLPLKG
jgi:hypothetical protein